MISSSGSSYANEIDCHISVPKATNSITTKDSGTGNCKTTRDINGSNSRILGGKDA